MMSEEGGGGIPQISWDLSLSARRMLTVKASQQWREEPSHKTFQPAHLRVARLYLCLTSFTIISLFPFYPPTSRGRRHRHLTDEADDAADQRVEVAAVARHDGLLLEQQGLPRGPHHVHGHLTYKDLVRDTHTKTNTQTHTQVNMGQIPMRVDPDE